MESILKVEHLEKYYGNRGNVTKAVDDISFTVTQGEYIGIMGASGSGKTTLLSLLGGLDTPKSGEILFEGKNISEMGLEQYRHNCVSFVFQNYNLIEYMTPKENVELVDARATADTLHQVGLTDDEINRNVLKLSGGQQQRVAIARALSSPAPVILADEPTGNLDEDTAHDVTELLVERARSLDKCVIIVSHSNEVAAAGDVILRFSHGEITVE